MKKISLAYTNILFSEGLELIIKEFDEYEVIQSTAIENIMSDFPSTADILIFEFDYPKKAEIRRIYSILKNHPGLLILIISNFSSINTSSEILDSGINAYILKGCGKMDLLNALNKISEGKSYFCSEITRELVASKKEVQSQQDKILTDREKEILKYLVINNSSSDVAEALKISENTVKTHRRNIRSKLGAQNIIGMFLYAIRNKLVEFNDHDLCLECPYFCHS